MSNLTRDLIFNEAAKTLRREFEELVVIPHKGAKGTQVEKLLRKFLKHHLPRRFGVGAGFIIDREDSVSKQTDVIVYDAFNCPVYRASDDSAIFPSDNVAAVVEVKSRLDKDDLISAFNNINAVKRLGKTPPPPFPVPLFAQTLGCVFSFESPITLDKIAEHYLSIISSQTSPFYFVDYIVVLNRGIVTMAAKPKWLPGWATAHIGGIGGSEAEGMHIAVAVHEYGSKTLDAFIRHLLIHLMLFRGIVDNPGLVWRDEALSQMKLSYVTTITFEEDPDKRRKLLDSYRDEVRADFERGTESSDESPTSVFRGDGQEFLLELVEDDMSKPMFVTIAEGRKVEFINIDYVVRVEVLHPDGDQPGSGKLFLQDGSERDLDEGEINWIMRMMPDLIGHPAQGTQEPNPGYWKGQPGTDA